MVHGGVVALAVVGAVVSSSVRLESAVARGVIVSGRTPPPSASVHMILNDAHGTLRLIEERYKRELTDSLEASGIRPSLEAENACETDATAVHVRVIFRPDTSTTEWGLPSRTMGITTPSNHRRRSVFVFVPNILKTLGVDRRELDSSPRARVLVARAAARVTIHEVIHALLPDLDHRREGLFGLHLTRELLARTTPPIDPAIVDRLAERFKRKEPK